MRKDARSIVNWLG